jgi:hypothetical protein
MSDLTYARLWSLYWSCLRHRHFTLAASLHARLHALAAR